jgi:S-methyl-5-thioribose-1-phosphate isomerase
VPRCIDWQDGAVVLIDQTLLPKQEKWLRVADVDELVGCIRRLAVRGAPALGAAGALGVALAARAGLDVPAAASRLRTARPTAVNLARGVELALARLADGPDAVLAEACALLDQEAANGRAMGERGADLLRSICPDRPLRLLTHCNAGWLAAVEWGTALGVVAVLHERGRLARVYADETRPLLQGARLTTYELRQLGIDHRVVVDSAGPSLLARGMVDAVVVGADRITANGDVVNKIGTYPLSLAAARAGLPFLVAAPESTVDDGTPTGSDVPIEERDPAEVSPDGSPAWNPAFDVTPHDLVTAIVTERRAITGQPVTGQPVTGPPVGPSSVAGSR